MDLRKSQSSIPLNSNNDLKVFIKNKKEENSALKKLLSALENAKKKRSLK